MTKRRKLVRDNSMLGSRNRSNLTGVYNVPPLQPFSSAQKQVSCADSGTFKVPFVPIHIRSDAAEAAPKAQQQPQSDWSLISPMISAQCGQLVSESKESGGSIPSYIGCAPEPTTPASTKSNNSWRECSLTPHNEDDAPRACRRWP